MGIMDIFKKQTDNRKNHDFTEEERELSREIRKQKAEMAKQKQELELNLLKLENEKKKLELGAQIQELKDELLGFDDEDDAGNNPDQLLTGLLMQILSQKNNGGGVSVSNVSQTTPMATPSSVDLSDAQLLEIWESIPKAGKILAKKMNREQLTAYIKGQIPNISEESLNKAINLVYS